MSTSKLFRPTTILSAGVLVNEKSKQQAKETVCKPSELPIYTSESVVKKRESSAVQDEPGVIENTFGTVRRGLFTVVDELRTYKEIGSEYVNIGIEHAGGAIEYLQEKENTTPKYGAVAIGGFTGIIAGLRGGYFRRSLYGSIGALTMAAICYPNAAAEYSQEGLTEAKRYATIAYNFIYGVKKGETPKELPTLPKLPGSLSEAWDLVNNTIGSSKTASVTDEDKCKIPPK